MTNEKQITEIKNGWIVRSDSGKTYTVKQHTRLDDDGCMYFEMTCTCPGFKYREHCKHINAVMDSNQPVDDQAAERYI